MIKLSFRRLLRSFRPARLKPGLIFLGSQSIPCFLRAGLQERRALESDQTASIDIFHMTKVHAADSRQPTADRASAAAAMPRGCS